MIQEPARVQATTYEAQEQHRNSAASGERIYSSNCNCSQKRTDQIVPTRDSPMLTSTNSTTIPIVINTQPNPRIILLKVPTHTSSNSSNSSSSNNRTEQSAPRTRLIRIPFLPGSVPTTDSLNAALPSARSSVNFTTSATASRIVKPISRIPLTGTIYPQEPSSSCSVSQVNQVANDQVVNPPAVETVKQTVPVSSTPQTLASMAGIQLTGADMQCRQDMSGAMPTATVEEIDVPVFIDEFLQNIEATSTTSSNGKSEEFEKEICSETDIFDFDFDINLIAEDHIERKEMDQCNLELDSNYSDNFNSDLTVMDEFQVQQLDNAEEAEDMASICNGIDFGSDPHSDLDLDNILNSDPMLSTFSQGSILWSSSQTKYFNELPIPADENSMENYCFSQQSLGFGVGPLGGFNEDVCTATAVQEAPSTQRLGAKRTASAASLVPTVETLPQKRTKLILDINKSQISHPDVINTPDIIDQVLKLCEVNPPSNVSNHDQIYEELRSAEDSTSSQLPDFSAPGTPNSTYSISTSTSYAPSCQTGFAGLITAPVSPAASIASTSAFSATTSTNGNTKRKRGRPAKEHADGPDPELMSRMTENEAKVYRDRLKNNEASRVSRQKTRQREEEEKREEEGLQDTNNKLKCELHQLQGQVERLENHLKSIFMKNSTYVKPEPVC
ncbi:uncharacterized protein LOC108659968 [Drosophila navojoa]|uniref:uncharacterized protein LOC108659968 n=1 Tax=Drosophila navojoa TaxID=7232 RepID=UPI000846E698|nr:uncharacterized protein LOC108659968 [Drosophila navojoa]